jgi:FKBP-type peptidyl-prolyl cis-trans isomerase
MKQPIPSLVALFLLIVACASPLFGQGAQIELRPWEEIQAEQEAKEVRKANPYGDLGIPTPEDVAEPPEDAEWTASGLASKLLRPGSGEEPIGPYDIVMVKYTGWTADGIIFDTTEADNRPREFSLKSVVPGFSEGLQLMVTGEKRRLWIPSELGYRDDPSRPQGTLVFDIHLLSVKRAPAAPSDVAAVPEDAVRLESGMAYKILLPADGPKPGPQDHVLAHFSAWFPDGALYDSSVMLGKPIDFTMDLTVPAFAEAFQLMAVGEKRRLWVPEEMSKLNAHSDIQSDMVFDVELISFVEKPLTPLDVALTPRDAEFRESGLATKLLRAGSGTRHPAYGERVVVHYAGWTRDGNMFDASYNYGKPGTFTLDDRMPIGWNEALKLMVVGEKRRIWIPEDLAYGGREGRPEGMLVFEVELLDIMEGGAPRPAPTLQRTPASSDRRTLPTPRRGR